MTPGMRVCSPLYPTAGILRGIFDFEPGHRETSDKWLFVFRKRESIIIISVFNKSINNSRRRNRKLIICFIDHHLKKTFSSCFGHLLINVCFLTVWFGFQNPPKSFCVWIADKKYKCNQCNFTTIHAITFFEHRI